jgi:hypothetical protein
MEAELIRQANEIERLQGEKADLDKILLYQKLQIERLRHGHQGSNAGTTMSNMSKDEFINLLKILHSIDGWELDQAALDTEYYKTGIDDTWQENFVRDPVHVLLRSDDQRRDLIWSIMVNRHDQGASYRERLRELEEAELKRLEEETAAALKK